jgi:hypothetical protein
MLRDAGLRGVLALGGRREGALLINGHEQADVFQVLRQSPSTFLINLSKTYYWANWSRALNFMLNAAANFNERAARI